jgi:uroporphyrinogen III methyltransferase/synthase
MKVLITRPRAQSADFGAALQTAGFEPVYFPVIAIRPLEDLSALDAALAELERYAWVVFTSVNGVEIVFDRLEPSPPAPLPFRERGAEGGVRVAAVGKKTAAALQKHGLEPHFVPEEFAGDEILPGLGDLNGKWVLLPRAEIARQDLPAAIRAAGGRTHEVAVYHTLPAEADPEGLATLRAGVDWITFTSPSTVENFARLVRQHGFDPLNLPGNPKMVCIGPVTEKAARETGFEITTVAQEYTTAGLIAVISKQVGK